jgi:uncharacterized protein (TIGR03083 family)
MQHSQHVDAIRREGAALSAAARRAGSDAHVASCPDWTIADLLSHIGRIQHWVVGVVEMRPERPSFNWRQTDPPPERDRFDWFDEGDERLAATLGALAPDTPVWTWASARTAGFWSRRQAHEVAVHRWDAQTALGAPEPIDRELAVDGIQEVFDILPDRPGVGPITGNGETIHLHCTDGEGEWLVRFAPDGVVVTNEHAKGDVAARGTASDLLLLVWGRIPPERVETFGDASLLAHWHEQTRF